ncbi:class I adenylate-forming enzyme family protein [Amycolatopsis ultiminotia]|uniref:Class I adenylate-forming enzyme family protein n=1 Tax=Amycolatopsis ultiminotia TaxID=543629 RepID=A0ABP6UYD1_9PSEU
MPLKYDFDLLCHQVITHNARVFANDLAVVCEGRRLTWREVDEETNRFANALLDSGLRHGDRVALLMSAGLDSFIAFWGVIKAGLVSVPLNVLLDTGSLARLLGDSRARAVIANSGTTATLDSIRDRLPSVEDGRYLTAGEESEGWTSVTVLAAAASAAAPPVTIGPDDSITVLYTSGTTGIPKGIEHSHFSRLMYPLGFGMGLRVDHSSVAIVATPPYASGTWITMMPTMYRGGTLVILPKFSASAFLSAVEQEHGTHAFLVPTQFIALLNEPRLADSDVSSMRCLVTSGQPIAETTYQALERTFAGTGIYEVYGFSEGFATLRIPGDADRGKRRSVGKPVLLDDVRIISGTDGRELPPGEIGEIVAHSVGMMKGYLDNPELTEEIIWYSPETGRSYMRSGDVGYLDEDGYLYVSGRAKDMIKSGGLNIFAADIEEVFMAHPDVLEVAAIGLPDPKWGETPLLVVIPRPGSDLTEEDLRAWGDGKLARYQRPSRIVFREDLPRAVYGKVRKDALREEFGTGASLELSGGQNS